VKLTREHKRILLEEFEFAIEKMKENQLQEQKLFYFSSTYGVVSRLFNLKFEPQLVFVHMILNNAYSNIIVRMNAIKGGDNTVTFPEKYFDKLTEVTEELYTKLKNDEDTYEVLEKFVLLTFLTTGNGYYLYQRGNLKI
jgi:hypothetical protein